MATIGLDKLYYASITEKANGDEEYGTPVVLAKAMSADLSIEINEATLYADDGAAEVVKEFKEGTISLGVDDIGTTTAAALCGVVTDTKGVVISTAEDVVNPVAVGFRARKSNGKYRYFWLYRVIFKAPSLSFATKGDSISFNTPTIEGTIYRRNKEDDMKNHPWKVEITEGDTGADTTTITNWFTKVYEPAYKQVSSIAATYTGGSVKVGTSLDDLTGITVTATYADETTATVTGYTLSGSISAAGSNTITVTYLGKTATFTVTATAS